MFTFIGLKPTKQIELYRFLTVFFIYFGLAWVSCMINAASGIYKEISQNLVAKVEAKKHKRCLQAKNKHKLCPDDDKEPADGSEHDNIDRTGMETSWQGEVTYYNTIYYDNCYTR